VNSGSIVAGIVGTKKFAYDIWGDTVNIASRMESNSVTGKINISENTFQLVKNHFMRNSSKKQGHDENVLC
jgi:class 3 adenylate cyclase